MKTETYYKIDVRVLEMLNDAIWFLEHSGNRELAQQSIECARQLAWLAEDLGVITYKEWDNINSMLHKTYYNI